MSPAEKPSAKPAVAEHRRRLLAYGTAAVATAALAGCVASGSRSGSGRQAPGGGAGPTSVDLAGKTLRVYHGGDALTRDFRQDRANIELDSDDRIVSVWIG